jgi:hypothetical protein
MRSINLRTLFSRTTSFIVRSERTVGNAETHWLWLLLAALLVALLIGGVAVVALRGESSLPTPPAITVQTIDEEKLRTALERLAAEKARFENLTRTPPALVDPSR